MKRLSFAAAIGALAALFAGPASAQNTYTWTGASGGNWTTPGNWSSALAGTYAGTSAVANGGATTDIAEFSNATTNVGIDMAAAGGTLTAGAISMTSATALTIGNSSASPGVLRLNGTTVGGIANTLVSLTGTADLTIANAVGAGTSTMSLQLGATNGVFNVVGSARTLTVNTVISEAAANSALNFQGTGTMALNEANTYTGATNVRRGTMILSGANGSISSTALTTVSDGGILRLTNTTGGANNGDRIASAVTLNNGTFDFNTNASAALNYAETAGALSVSNAALNVVNSNGGNAGQTSDLTFASLARATSGGVNFTGANLGAGTQNRILFTAAPTVTNGIIGSWAFHNLTGTTGTFATYGANGVAASTVNTNLDGTGWGAAVNVKLTIAGFGNQFSGAAATINSLFVTSGAQAILNFNNTNLTVGSGGLAFNGNQTGGNRPIFTGAGSLTGTNLTVTIPQGSEADIRVPITGGTGITKLGGGLLVLSGTNTFTGAVLIGGSTSNNSGIQLDGAVNTALGATSGVTLRSSTSNAAGDRGTILNMNFGYAPGYNHPLSLEAFQVGQTAGNFSTVAPVLDTRTSLVTNSNNTWSGAVTLTGDGFVSLVQTNAANTLTMSGAVNGGAFTGVLQARGNGIVNLNGLLTLTNGTLATTDGTTVLNLPTNAASTVSQLQVYQGTMVARANNVFTAAPALVMGQNGTANTGIFRLNGFNQNVRSLNVATGSTSTAANQFIENNNATTASTLTFAGTGAPSSFGGTLRNGAAAALNLTVTGGNLALTGTASSYTGATTINGGTLSVASVADAGANSSIGAAAVAATNLAFGGGTLNYTGGSASSNRGFTVNAGGGTINVNSSAANLTFSGASTLTGTLTKTGPGTLTLSGASAGAGATNVLAGTLAVNNSTGAATGTGLTVMSSGTTIMGSGTLGGGLTTDNGSTISPGNSVGTLTSNGGVTTWHGGATYVLEYNHDAGGPFVSGTTIDQYVSAGTLNLTASAGTPFNIVLDYLGSGNGSQAPQSNVVIASFAGAAPSVTQAQFNITGDFVGATPVISVVGNSVVMSFTPVPEPATVGLLAAGALSGLAALRRRRKVAA